MGINSWLEDELYQQYLHDRSTVDESWKHVFEEPRPRRPTARRSRGRSRRTPPRPRPNPRPASNLQPLRGAAGTHRREHGGQRRRFRSPPRSAPSPSR